MTEPTAGQWDRIFALMDEVRYHNPWFSDYEVWEHTDVLLSALA